MAFSSATAWAGDTLMSIWRKSAGLSGISAQLEA